eukprot:TRINITY_DN5227_c0_g1_i1.p1 TRINITY_DN5227_c0_g1~~TRINITY_DN5227_c0_g1_i1.p1  ORF type:complete len:315 (-),score=74.13 TRINITY_DN5227_c0_g1_i1:247-1191(-)
MAFSGLTFCISGAASIPRNELINLIKANKGQHSIQLNRKVTHLVCCKDHHQTSKFKLALQYDTILVSEKFVHDCAEKKELLSEKDYYPISIENRNSDIIGDDLNLTNSGSVNGDHQNSLDIENSEMPLEIPKENLIPEKENNVVGNDKSNSEKKPPKTQPEPKKKPDRPKEKKKNPKSKDDREAQKSPNKNKRKSKPKPKVSNIVGQKMIRGELRYVVQFEGLGSEHNAAWTKEKVLDRLGQKRLSIAETKFAEDVSRTFNPDYAFPRTPSRRSISRTPRKSLTGKKRKRSSTGSTGSKTEKKRTKSFRKDSIA